MIPLVLKVNEVTKNLWQIMEPDGSYGSTEEEQIAYAIKHLMFPTEVKLTSETYCRNADRTANYELKSITNVNAKSKPEFTWDKLKAVYAKRLLNFLGFKYDYLDGQGNIQPEEAPTINVTYLDFNGMRTISAYLGQTIEGTLVEYFEMYEGLIYSRVDYQGDFIYNQERCLTTSPGDADITTEGEEWSIYVELDQGNQIKIRVRNKYDNEEESSFACSKVIYKCISDSEITIELYRTVDSQYVQFHTFSLKDLTYHSRYITMQILVGSFAGRDSKVKACFNTEIVSKTVAMQKRIQYWENFRIAFPER